MVNVGLRDDLILMKSIDRAMCPLREAAERIGVSISSLLKDAIEGRMPIYVKVPEGMRVLCVHPSHLRNAKTTKLDLYEVLCDPPFLVKGVQYLALKMPNLRGLYNNGFDQVSNFQEGISFDQNGHVINFDAAIDTAIPGLSPYGDLKIPMSHRSYVLYPVEVRLPRHGLLPSPWAGEINLDNVHISRIDIFERLNKKEIKVFRLLGSFEGEYISPNLSDLRDFFKESLKDKNREKVGLALKRFDIDLQSRFEFEAPRAEAGAVIVAHSMDAIFGSSRKLQSEKIAIIILFECAKHYWGEGDLKPSVKAIVTWLKGKGLSIGDSYLEACAAILRPPQYAKRGRPSSGSL